MDVKQIQIRLEEMLEADVQKRIELIEKGTLFWEALVKANALFTLSQFRFK